MEIEIQKNETTLSLLTNRFANRHWKHLIERIAAENKYFEREGRANKQIPSPIDFMTGRFYIGILFMKRFQGIADFAFQTRSQSVLAELWVS